MIYTGVDWFSELKKEVFRLMDERLSSGLFYHNKDHTSRVIDAVQWLCDAESISGRDRYLLNIAALFHDIGFIESYENHEEKSCQIARHLLSNHDFPEVEIRAICELILSTKIPHNPKNHLEQIICDADLNYLGEKDFYAIGEQLRKELIRYQKIGTDAKSWNQQQLNFLETHTFFTDTSKVQREPVKQKFLDQIKAKLHKS